MGFQCTRGGLVVAKSSLRTSVNHLLVMFALEMCVSTDESKRTKATPQAMLY